MRALLERLPQLVWGRPWSPFVPSWLEPPLERFASEHLYRSVPRPHIRLREGRAAANLVMAGDLALHHWSDSESPSAIFDDVRSIFRDADFSMVNLESVLTSHGQPAGRLGKFLKAPPAAVACLHHLGISAVTSANNHALDFGAVGLAECGDLLRRAGIDWCGIDEGVPAPGGLTREINGLVVGVVAATDHFGGIPEAAGPAPTWLDPVRLCHSIRALRSTCHVVVVQLHWGYEWVMYPLRSHRDLARQFVDAGADLVCCHHAHVVMGVERWGRGVIAHGLGNFYGSRSRRHPLGRFGIVLRASVDRAGLVAAEVVTVHTDAAGAVRTSDHACPGFHRLCEQLADDAALDRIEHARVEHTLARMADELRNRLAESDVAGLLERQAFLTAPRQEWLLARAATAASPEWRRFGAWLNEFRSLPSETLRRLAITPMPDAGRLRRATDRRRLPGRWP